MTFRSRWGYHACNYQTLLKLRRIHKAYWQGLCLLARWRRWKAKKPHNRIGPEPVVPAVLKQVCASPIVREYQTARHGVATPEEVEHLGFKDEQLDRWIAQLDA